MITLQIKPRGRPIKKLPSKIELDLATATAETLYTRLSAYTGLSGDRLRLTKGSDGSVVTVRRESGKDVMVEELGLRDGSAVFVKDLGPQVAWRTVFVIEYLGPLFIHPLLLYVVRPYIYSSSPLNPLSYIPFGPSLKPDQELPPPTQTQTLLCALVVLHFLKREYETFFIHRFSGTMPFRYIFRNSAHYWILSGLNLAYSFYTPAASPAASWWPAALNADNNSVIVYSVVSLWVFAQISNFKTHLILRNLRPANSTKRQIPKGYGFNSVTCPNYFFEVLSWVCVWVLSGGNWAASLFTLTGMAVMFLWAQKKERRYRKEFGSAYKKKRNVIVPGLL
ncbi:hypothetical protein C7212DRAFT_319546 [Tuber magnatum]|uniref:3-oxo-5-alpha-steroid 4-dehydrogenase C-terminal domain-containing protein n=1 Tax=Tuber magnatum TaxID=42249 RepID=A0A317SSF7_9PEZI|nr:hypothetical protein C7212DRAFT_319546 [Tuber magnatum]